jgi:hypothetical protein
MTLQPKMKTRYVTDVIVLSLNSGHWIREPRFFLLRAAIHCQVSIT